MLFITKRKVFRPESYDEYEFSTELNPSVSSERARLRLYFDGRIALKCWLHQVGYIPHTNWTHHTTLDDALQLITMPVRSSNNV